MKKYIFTETQIKNIINNVISEQATTMGDKFPFAFDEKSTDFQGEIKNGYLFITLEGDYKGRKIFKIGPVKSAKTSNGMVTITKSNGNVTLKLGGFPLVLQNGYTVTPVG